MRERRGRVVCSFTRQAVYIPHTLTVRIPRKVALQLIERGWVHFVVNVEDDEIVYTPLTLSLDDDPTRWRRIYYLRRFTCSREDRFGLTVPVEAAVVLGIDHGDLVEVRIHERAIVVRPLRARASRAKSDSLMKRRGRIAGRWCVGYPRVSAAAGSVQEAGRRGEEEGLVRLRSADEADRHASER